MLKYMIKMSFNTKAFRVCDGCYPKKCSVTKKQGGKTKIKVIVDEETHKSTALSFHGIAKKHVEAIQHLGKGTATLVS